MLAHKYQASPRPPLVHERIALQCAKNISKLAAALPKPRTRSGHLPVMVELRNLEEDTIYRYQVNLPPSCVDRDRRQMNTDQVKALSQQLKLPCLVHGEAGRTGQDASASAAAAAAAVADNSCTLMATGDTQTTQAPQLLMMQEAVHVVHQRSKPGRPLASQEAISSFHNTAYACGASQITQDHFMATLHEEKSLLDCTVLWPIQEQEQQQQSSRQEAYEVPQAQCEIERKPLLAAAVQPLNGFKLQSSRPSNYMKKQQQPLRQQQQQQQRQPQQQLQQQQQPQLQPQQQKKKRQRLQLHQQQQLQQQQQPKLQQQQQQQQSLQHQQQLQQQQQQLQLQPQQQQQRQLVPLPPSMKSESSQLQLPNGYRMPRKPAGLVHPYATNVSSNSNNNSNSNSNNNSNSNSSISNSSNCDSKQLYPQKPAEAMLYNFPPPQQGSISPPTAASGQCGPRDPVGQDGPGGSGGPSGSLAPLGYKYLNHERVAYCDPRVKRTEHLEQPPSQAPPMPSACVQLSRMDNLWPIYAHLPRVYDYSKALDLQRELQQRQKHELGMESQKLFEHQKFQRLFTDGLLDSQVPPELQSMFLWECCHLCNTVMRTMRNALDHYLSRTHLRRVDSWLIRYSFVKGNLSEDMLRHLRTSGPAGLHCDLCDLKLTSVIHARQHFYGRRHRLVERHISKPNGEGYYDKSGRWVRTNNKWLMCKLCDVIVTSESQLSIHMAGVRHRKRERSTAGASATLTEPCDGSHVYRIFANGSLAPLNPLGYYMYADCVKQDVRKLHDLNAAYYCEVCNITLNHLKSVKQHEEGRLHRKRLERVSLAGYVCL